MERALHPRRAAAGQRRRADLILHRANRTLAVLAIALLAAGCGSDGEPQAGGSSTSAPTTSQPTTSEPTPSPPLTGGRVDWNDRSSVDISLPTGWRIVACEGDAPFLCAVRSDGTVDGSILLAEYPAPDSAGSRDEIEAEAAELHRTIEEDRRATCGPEHRLEPDAVTPVAVGGTPGFRHGFSLVDGAGAVTERVVLHIVLDGSRQIVINTAFSDPAGCPGEDPERIEFPIEAVDEIVPYLDQLVAESILPTPTGPR